MTLKLRVIAKPLLCGIALLGGLTGFSLWNKSDFCRGWAAHFAERAASLREEQAIATIENRPEDAAAIARNVQSLALIASKYERVASNPFLAYPTRPLVTDSELETARKKTDL